MRRWFSYVALVLALGLLASVPAIRSCSERDILERLKENSRYHAAHYWKHLDEIDGSTRQHLDFEVVWDSEDRSPFSKGSAPSVIETLSDGSKVISIVGVYRDDPLEITVTVEGYESVRVGLKPMTSGILSPTDANVREVLTLSRSGDKGGAE